MIWILLAAAWVGLSVPVGLLVGRAIVNAELNR